jgi:hypothetical protein
MDATQIETPGGNFIFNAPNQKRQRISSDFTNCMSSRLWHSRLKHQPFTQFLPLILRLPFFWPKRNHTTPNQYTRHQNNDNLSPSHIRIMPENCQSKNFFDSLFSLLSAIHSSFFDLHPALISDILCSATLEDFHHHPGL